MTRGKTAFLFDLDGTLIDSVYQHVLAWKTSLDEEGISLSVWRIHRKMGMSGYVCVNYPKRRTGKTPRMDLSSARCNAASLTSRRSPFLSRCTSTSRPSRLLGRL